MVFQQISRLIISFFVSILLIQAPSWAAIPIQIPQKDCIKQCHTQILQGKEGESCVQMKMCQNLFWNKDLDICQMKENGAIEQLRPIKCPVLALKKK
jgi:hypothetical protein